MPTIKAGNYEWKESLTIPNANGLEYFPIFELDEFVLTTSANLNGQTIPYRCKEIGLAIHYNGELPDFKYYGEAYVDLMNPGTPEWTPIDVQPYSYDNNTWVGTVFAYTLTFSREFTITKDITVSDDAFAWFNGSTKATTPYAKVSYNGEIIATVESGQTKTIKCKGKIMKDDIVISL